MQVEVDPMALPYVDMNKIQGSDEGGVRLAQPAGGGYRLPADRGVVLQRQWVTLTASMWPGPAGAPTSEHRHRQQPPVDAADAAGDAPRPPAPAAAAPPAGLRVPALAAAFCGAALVACLAAAFLLYRCCAMPRRHDKHYCLRKVDPATAAAVAKPPAPGGAAAPPPPAGAAGGAGPPPVAVFAERRGPGGAWGYSSRLVGPAQPNPWYTSRVIGGPECTRCPGACPAAVAVGAVPRSCSTPAAQRDHQQNHYQSPATRRQRPVSQPIPSSVIINGEIVPKSTLPEISEFSPNSPQYASSSILDEFGATDEPPGESALKTRSLPAWVRSKPRPLSTEDDLNDLYAKVNFSKKRKNRMRNDEAAIIALSKSRSQFLHKDTDSLVDNEAVIVYDERTAL